MASFPSSNPTKNCLSDTQTQNDRYEVSGLERPAWWRSDKYYTSKVSLKTDMIANIRRYEMSIWTAYRMPRGTSWETTNGGIVRLRGLTVLTWGLFELAGAFDCCTLTSWIPSLISSLVSVKSVFELGEILWEATERSWDVVRSKALGRWWALNREIEIGEILMTFDAIAY